MSYFGKFSGHSYGNWFGTTVVATVRRYVLRIKSHVQQTVVLMSRVF